MHELSVTENILEIALRYANAEQAVQITDLYLVIGQLSSIIDESVQFYWNFITKDTIAENATLHFRRIPAIFRCKKCKNEYSPDGNSYNCPLCSSNDVSVKTGDEFYLESILIRK